MNHTHIHDDHTQLVPNRAYSYRSVNKQYQNAVLSYANSGATSLFTNVPDLSKWVMNFHAPKIGDPQVLAELTRNGVLNNGKPIRYASGINVDDYRGWKQYSHGGADAGFRTFVSVFPEAKMGIIVFSNFAEGNPSERAYEVINLLLKDKSVKNLLATQTLADSSMAKLADATALQGFAGDYYAPDGTTFTYRLKNGKFYWQSPTAELLLASVAENTFSTLTLGPRSTFVFARNADGSEKMEQTEATGEKIFKRITPIKLDAASQSKLLQEYEGTYYSPELDYRYTLVIKGQKMILADNKSAGRTFDLLEKDVLLSSGLLINVKRDKRHHVNQLEFNSSRVKHLTLDKLQESKSKPKSVARTGRKYKEAPLKPVGS